MTQRRPAPPRRLRPLADALVFAYGSNLLLAQMHARCPTANFVSRGRLRNHTLRFAGYSNRWHGAVAQATRLRGRAVCGVVYCVRRAELARLDQLEGVPFVYQRVTRAIDCDDGARRIVQVYLQPELGLELGAPSVPYLRQILGGYLDHQFDTRAVLRAIQESMP